MKKLLIGSTLAVGLLFSGAGQSPASANSIGLNGVGGVNAVDLKGMDIESAMMAVQQQRANLLETQLKDQIAGVQAKNEQIAALNDQLSSLNAEKAQTSDATKLTELEIQIQALKSQVDAMSNSQQMDMLRLQSLSNKRNEAFDLMTNFIKKMQESRSSILGNMR